MKITQHGGTLDCICAGLKYVISSVDSMELQVKSHSNAQDRKWRGRDESQRGSFCCAWPTINRSRRKYVDQLMMQRVEAVSRVNKGWNSS